MVMHFIQPFQGSYLSYHCIRVSPVYPGFTRVHGFHPGLFMVNPVGVKYALGEYRMLFEGLIPGFHPVYS